MKLRIISGRFGGRNIQAPDTGATHPMGERVRNALFNTIGDEIEGAQVLDAFAGSGSLGLEAISRGAAHATFIERDSRAVVIMNKNIDTFGLQAETTVFQGDVGRWADSNRNSFDIILVDPPYDDSQFLTVAKLTKYLKPNGLMVLSYPGRGEAPTGIYGVVVVDNRRYGTAALTFYRQKDI